FRSVRARAGAKTGHRDSPCYPLSKGRSLMHEVFINYRTCDGDEAAILIERTLSGRFGTERIFRAAKSIPPGEPYPETLLNAARSSTILLAVMGPDWSRFPQLRDQNDWV